MAELEGSVRAGFHVMLMGPRGTGKTTAVRLVARKFGKRLFTIQGHSDLTVEELRGVPGLHGGNSTFVPSPVVHAVREGAFLLLDEANLCRPGVTAWLNNILDHEGVLSIPETGELLAVPADFRAFLCFNAGYEVMVWRYGCQVERLSRRDGLRRGRTMGSTATHLAVREAHTWLAARPARRKVAVLFTDGQPNSVASTAEEVVKLRRTGADLLVGSMGVGELACARSMPGAVVFSVDPLHAGSSLHVALNRLRRER